MLPMCCPAGWTGRAGATVHVTGRSTRKDGATTERPLGEGASDATLDATCEAIREAGGVGIPIRSDASSDDDVRALMAQVEKEAGRLDVLVCSAFTTPPQLNDAAFRDDFWKQGAQMWDACNEVGLRGVYMAACEAAPLMIKTSSMARGSRPLIVLVSSFGGKSYTFNVRMHSRKQPSSFSLYSHALSYTPHTPSGRVRCGQSSNRSVGVGHARPAPVAWCRHGFAVSGARPDGGQPGDGSAG